MPSHAARRPQLKREDAISNVENVRAVERAFRILQAINTRSGTTAQEIAQSTTIPRATVYRLLETMEQMKLIVRDRLSKKWRVALHAKSLSSGFREADWVCQIVIPKMVNLGKQILWPVDLMVLQDDEMEIRESTNYLSPYALDRGMVGARLPIIDTASGRAFLAFAPEAESQKVLNGLAVKYRTDVPSVTRDGPLKTVLQQCRELGVGFRKQGFRVDTMSISAPVYLNDSVMACMTIIWLSSALKFEDAVTMYRDRLLEMAQDISSEIAKLSTQELHEDGQRIGGFPN